MLPVRKNPYAAKIVCNSRRLRVAKLQHNEQHHREKNCSSRHGDQATHDGNKASDIQGRRDSQKKAEQDSAAVEESFLKNGDYDLPTRMLDYNEPVTERLTNANRKVEEAQEIEAVALTPMAREK